jgi:sulfur-oxidizing protein SoxX
MRGWAALAASLACAAAAEGIDKPLAPAGDAARGREIVLARESNCVLCHSIPGLEGRAAGDLGPSLAGVGAKLRPAQLRLRIVDSSRLNPATIMPPYHRVEGLTAVAREFRGRPILTAQEVEDVVAYLGTLK